MAEAERDGTSRWIRIPTCTYCMAPRTRARESLKGGASTTKRFVINVPLDGLLSNTECVVEGSETCERAGVQRLRYAARFILLGAKIQLLTTCRTPYGNKERNGDSVSDNVRKRKFIRDSCG